MKGNVYIHNQAGGNLLLVPVAATGLLLGLTPCQFKSDSLAQRNHSAELGVILPVQYPAKAVLRFTDFMSKLLLCGLGFNLFAQFGYKLKSFLFNLFHNKKGAEAPLSLFYLGFKNHLSGFVASYLNNTTLVIGEVTLIGAIVTSDVVNTFLLAHCETFVVAIFAVVEDYIVSFHFVWPDFIALALGL